MVHVQLSSPLTSRRPALPLLTAFTPPSWHHGSPPWGRGTPDRRTLAAQTHPLLAPLHAAYASYPGQPRHGAGKEIPERFFGYGLQQEASFELLLRALEQLDGF